MRISPAVEAPTCRRHRYAYGHTGFRHSGGVRGGGGDETDALVFGPHGAVVKMDADAGVAMARGNTPSNAPVTTWSDGVVYPSEPIFVPRPGGRAEDDGVLLVLGYDTSRRESLLLIIDAPSMSEVARAYTGGIRCPPTFHGQWIPFDPQCS